MHRIWKFIYLAGGALTVLGGYQSLAPARTAKTNADWVFVTITFVMACVFPLLAMAYSGRKGVEIFRRPSLDRQPLGWWNDTLQPIRVTLIITALTFVGAGFALPKADHRGVMIFWFYAALTFGWIVGERLVYRMYAKRITSLASGESDLSARNPKSNIPKHFWYIMLFVSGFILFVHLYMVSAGVPQMETAVRQEVVSLSQSNESLRSLQLGRVTSTRTVGSGVSMTGSFQFDGGYSNQSWDIIVNWRKADTNAPIDKIEIGSTYQELRTLWSRK